jgi:hypothetical protein
VKTGKKKKVSKSSRKLKVFSIKLKEYLPRTLASTAFVYTVMDVLTNQRRKK